MFAGKASRRGDDIATAAPRLAPIIKVGRVRPFTRRFDLAFPASGSQLAGITRRQLEKKSALSDRIFAGCLIAVLLLAILLRLPGLRSGLPYSSYIDEGHLLLRVMHVLRDRTWDPAWYNYPSLTIYLVSGAVLLWSPIHAVIFGNWIHVPENIGQFYGFLAPVEVLVIGRIVTMILSVAAVWLAARLARRLAGGWAGLLAGLAAAVTPALVLRGGFVIVDTVAAFFVIASLNATLELQRRADHRSRWSFLCGLCAGWAFTAKYPSGAVVLSVLPVILCLPISHWNKLALMATAGAGLLCGMVSGMPALVLRTRAVMEAIAIEVTKYSQKVSVRSYLTESLRSTELGWVFPLAALAGLVVLLWRRQSRSMAIGWVLMGLAFLFPLLRSSFQPVRNLEPLVVIGCVAIGALPWIAPISDRLRPLAGCVILAFILVAPAIALPDWARANWDLTDSRTLAVECLVAHVQAGEKVLISREIVVLPSEVARIPGKVEVVDRRRMTAELRAHKPIDWIMTGQFLPPKSQNTQKWAEWPSESVEIESQQLYTAFGRIPIPVTQNFWYGNQPRILIYHLHHSIDSMERPEVELSLAR